MHLPCGWKTGFISVRNLWGRLPQVRQLRPMQPSWAVKWEMPSMPRGWSLRACIMSWIRKRDARSLWAGRRCWNCWRIIRSWKRLLKKKRASRQRSSESIWDNSSLNRLVPSNQPKPLSNWPRKRETVICLHNRSGKYCLPPMDISSFLTALWGNRWKKLSRLLMKLFSTGI